jgi:hypothetical protein
VNEEITSSVLSGEAEGFPVAEALFADHSNQAEQLLRIQLDFLKNENTERKGYDVYYFSRDPYAEITTLKPEELDDISGIRYFAGYEDSDAHGTMIRKFDGRCGRPIYIYKADR